MHILNENIKIWQNEVLYYKYINLLVKKFDDTKYNITVVILIKLQSFLPIKYWNGFELFYTLFRLS